MIILAACIAGSCYGWLVASRRNGSLADKAQYCAGYGVAFLIVGFIATILLDRFV